MLATSTPSFVASEAFKVFATVSFISNKFGTLSVKFGNTRKMVKFLIGFGVLNGRNGVVIGMEEVMLMVDEGGLRKVETGESVVLEVVVVEVVVVEVVEVGEATFIVVVTTTGVAVVATVVGEASE